MPAKKEKSKITEDLAKLKKIVEWFEAREEVDVEEGLEKVKEGSEIVKRLKARMGEIENEFEMVKKDLEQ
ncbi:exodeoxyribonuclease VII small subunit [Patescibacteria group bacterium]|nr:exodeoxyribonuclease VII small subunit [Patescibacteria group bacterium]MCL5114713.1 exodeoxyribonuclease VII small subunit [Patescibacteria group bacterium]